MTAPTHKTFRDTLALLLLLTVVFCGGCKSYKLGHPAELPFETIYIQPAKNDSFAPQAQALISAQVREEVIRDGRVKLITDPGKADAVLAMTLTDYSRKAAARRQDDTEVAQNFDLRLRVQLDLYDQHNGKYFFQGREVEARTTGYINNPYANAAVQNTQGLIQSEYNAMPQLARELGQKAADELLGVW
jgi:hypothetical protein